MGLRGPGAVPLRGREWYEEERPPKPVGKARIEAMERVSASTGQNLPNDLLNLTGMNVPPTKLTMGWCVECHRAVNVKGVHAIQNIATLPVPSVKVPSGSETAKLNAPLECVICHH
jgi:hypothetical protein